MRECGGDRWEDLLAQGLGWEGGRGGGPAGSPVLSRVSVPAPHLLSPLPRACGVGRILSGTQRLEQRPGMGGGPDPACQTLRGPLGCEAPCPDGGKGGCRGAGTPRAGSLVSLPGAGGTQDGVPGPGPGGGEAPGGRQFCAAPRGPSSAQEEVTGDGDAGGGRRGACEHVSSAVRG